VSRAFSFATARTLQTARVDALPRARGETSNLRLDHAGTIPRFPRFRPLQISDRSEIEAFTRGHPPYSDYNFVSLFAWNIDERTQVSTLNRNLIVKLQDYATGEEFLSVFGTNAVRETLEEALGFARSHGMRAELRLVPQSTVGAMEAGWDLRVSEDRDNFDYVISTHDFVAMEGGPHSERRRLLSKFRRDYGQYAEVASLDLADAQVRSNILDASLVWAASKGLDPVAELEAQNEQRALERLTGHPEISPSLVAIGVFVDSKLLGFAIEEILPERWALGHFLKADRACKGLFQLLEHEAAALMKREGVLYHNWEQDLGMEGLRTAKMRCRPTSFLKKYSISLAGAEDLGVTSRILHTSVGLDRAGSSDGKAEVSAIGERVSAHFGHSKG
jgi:hypothetical protein